MSSKAMHEAKAYHASRAIRGVDADRSGLTIDVTIDGEYAAEREVKVVMTTQQFRIIAEALREADDKGNTTLWAAFDSFTEAYDSVANDLKFH